MPDAQFLAAGTQAAPLDYTLPGAQELLLKACYAHYDGSGAGGAYLPTLQILGPAGDTVAEIPMDSSVAAGSSVEATWAPFLRSAMAAAATATDAEYAWLTFQGEAVVSVIGHGTTFIPWYTFQTTNTAVFSAAMAGAQTLTLLKAGVYVLEAKVLWNDLGAIIDASIVGTAISHLDGGDTYWIGNWNWIKNTSPDGATEMAIRDVATAQLDPGIGGPGNPPRSVLVRIDNYDAVAHTLNVAYLKAAYLPSAHAMSQIFP